ncbi:MAG: SDH family Clp fold serine proteinase [Thermoprotei archaeon]
MSNASDLQSILQENLYLTKRRELLSQIEEELSKAFNEKLSVASYIANTLDTAVAGYTTMSLAHVTYLDDLIRTASVGAGSVALILESYGGEATFPSEIIQRAKKYCKSFYVIVVNVAKSAGTLLSLLSDGIIALETASFGPIDPQIVISTQQGPQVVSARQIKELIEVTLPNYIKSRDPAERAAILGSQNYVLYQQALDAIKLVQNTVDQQLKGRLTPAQIQEVKKKLVDVPLSHEIKVTPDDLEDLGFELHTLKANEELGAVLIQYHRRALRSLMAEVPPGNKGLILFENKKVSFQIVAQIFMQPLPGTARPQQQVMPPQSQGERKAPPSGSPEHTSSGSLPEDTLM